MYFLPLQVHLVPIGLHLFKGDNVTKEHPFCLFRCFAHLKNGQDITFTDSSVERILDIKTLLPFEGEFLTIIISVVATNSGIVIYITIKNGIFVGFFSAQESDTVNDWIDLIISRREEVLERCGSPGLNPIPLGQYPLAQQSSVDSDQSSVVKPKRVFESL